jgi:hypothetical protein
MPKDVEEKAENKIPTDKNTVTVADVGGAKPENLSNLFKPQSSKDSASTSSEKASAKTSDTCQTATDNDLAYTSTATRRQTTKDASGTTQSFFLKDNMLFRTHEDKQGNISFRRWNPLGEEEAHGTYNKKTGEEEIYCGSNEEYKVARDRNGKVTVYKKDFDGNYSEKVVDKEERQKAVNEANEAKTPPQVLQHKA